MTRRRWIADEVSGNHASLTGAHADHLIRVLRARVGQEFDVVAAGTVRRGRIASIADGRVALELGEALSAMVTPEVTLVLAIFKFDRMEWAIEKCTELGVARIVPLIADRTATHLAAASAKRAERWQRIALQASEQSRRAAPPEIADPIKLKEAATIPAAVRLVLSESEQQQSIRDAMDYEAGGESPGTSPHTDVVLAIGPEGGWTPGELQLLKMNGWMSVSLGNTILRAETAAIAATAIVMAELTEP